MKTILPVFICLFLFLSACGPADLERSRVPLIWGMRFDSPESEREVNANLALMRDLKMRELMLELPLLCDSAGLPFVPDLPIGSMKGLLLSYRVGLHLTFAPTNSKSLFPSDSLTVQPEAWFERLEKEINQVMEVFSPCPIDRVVVGSNLQPVEAFTSMWQSTFDSLRKGRETLFSYGGSLDRLADFDNLRVSDEFALDYRPISGEDMKAESRDYHEEIQYITDSLHMPLFVFRANIIGEDPLMQFKNRLRFWRPQTRHRGMAINTLYAPIPPRDAKTYYGLADNPEFMEFVHEYLTRD
jgi:hypothetical protein